MYQVETELKQRAKKAKLGTRDLAYALGEPPGTTANRLNGFIPLRKSQREILMQKISEAEERLKSQGS